MESRNYTMVPVTSQRKDMELWMLSSACIEDNTTTCTGVVVRISSGVAFLKSLNYGYLQMLVRAQLIIVEAGVVLL